MLECVICHENLNAPASGLNDSNNNGRNSTGSHQGSPSRLTEVVATECGHLFHRHCLKQWIRRCHGGAAGADYTVPAPNCPICRRTHLQMKDCRRVFLTNVGLFDEELQQLARAKEQINELEASAEQNRAELGNREKEIEELNLQLETKEAMEKNWTDIFNRLENENAKMQEFLEEIGVSNPSEVNNNNRTPTSSKSLCSRCKKSISKSPLTASGKEGVAGTKRGHSSSVGRNTRSAKLKCVKGVSTTDHNDAHVTPTSGALQRGRSGTPRPRTRAASARGRAPSSQ